MAKLSFFGLFLIILPFIVMGLEVIYANMIGATGERLMAAGFYGVFVGYFTVIPGFLLVLVGAVLWMFDR
jgi:hypothetical protein